MFDLTTDVKRQALVGKVLTSAHILCRIFIGQASGKAVGVGMKQAEQKKVLTDFRSGAFNTLVATCIGEEGLDIPQVG